MSFNKDAEVFVESFFSVRTADNAQRIVDFVFEGGVYYNTLKAELLRVLLKEAGPDNVVQNLQRFLKDRFPTSVRSELNHFNTPKEKLSAVITAMEDKVKGVPAQQASAARSSVAQPASQSLRVGAPVRQRSLSAATSSQDSGVGSGLGPRAGARVRALGLVVAEHSATPSPSAAYSPISPIDKSQFDAAAPVILSHAAAAASSSHQPESVERSQPDLVERKKFNSQELLGIIQELLGIIETPKDKMTAEEITAAKILAQAKARNIYADIPSSLEGFIREKMAFIRMNQRVSVRLKAFKQYFDPSSGGSKIEELGEVEERIKELSRLLNINYQNVLDARKAVEGMLSLGIEANGEASPQQGSEEGIGAMYQALFNFKPSEFLIQEIIALAEIKKLAPQLFPAVQQPSPALGLSRAQSTTSLHSVSSLPGGGKGINFRPEVRELFVRLYLGREPGKGDTDVLDDKIEEALTYRGDNAQDSASGSAVSATAQLPKTGRPRSQSVGGRPLQRTASADSIASNSVNQPKIYSNLLRQLGRAKVKEFVESLRKKAKGDGVKALREDLAKIEKYIEDIDACIITRPRMSKETPSGLYYQLHILYFLQYGVIIGLDTRQIDDLSWAGSFQETIKAENRAQDSYERYQRDFSTAPVAPVLPPVVSRTARGRAASVNIRRHANASTSTDSQDARGNGSGERRSNVAVETQTEDLAETRVFADLNSAATSDSKEGAKPVTETAVQTKSTQAAVQPVEVADAVVGAVRPQGAAASSAVPASSASNASTSTNQIEYERPSELLSLLKSIATSLESASRAATSTTSSAVSSETVTRLSQDITDIQSRLSATSTSQTALISQLRDAITDFNAVAQSLRSVSDRISGADAGIERIVELVGALASQLRDSDEAHQRQLQASDKAHEARTSALADAQERNQQQQEETQRQVSGLASAVEALGKIVTQQQGALARLEELTTENKAQQAEQLATISGILVQLKDSIILFQTLSQTVDRLSSLTTEAASSAASAAASANVVAGSAASATAAASSAAGAASDAAGAASRAAGQASQAAASVVAAAGSAAEAAAAARFSAESSKEIWTTILRDREAYAAAITAQMSGFTEKLTTILAEFRTSLEVPRASEAAATETVQESDVVVQIGAAAAASQAQADFTAKLQGIVDTLATTKQEFLEVLGVVQAEAAAARAALEARLTDQAEAIAAERKKIAEIDDRVQKEREEHERRIADLTTKLHDAGAQYRTDSAADRTQLTAANATQLAAIQAAHAEIRAAHEAQLKLLLEQKTEAEAQLKKREEFLQQQKQTLERLQKALEENRQEQEKGRREHAVQIAALLAKHAADSASLQTQHREALQRQNEASQMASNSALAHVISEHTRQLQLLTEAHLQQTRELNKQYRGGFGGIVSEMRQLWMATERVGATQERLTQEMGAGVVAMQTMAQQITKVTEAVTRLEQVAPAAHSRAPASASASTSTPAPASASAPTPTSTPAPAPAPTPTPTLTLPNIGGVDGLPSGLISASTSELNTPATTHRSETSSGAGETELGSAAAQAKAEEERRREAAAQAQARRNALFGRIARLSAASTVSEPSSSSQPPKSGNISDDERLFLALNKLQKERNWAGIQPADQALITRVLTQRLNPDQASAIGAIAMRMAEEINKVRGFASVNENERGREIVMGGAVKAQELVEGALRKVVPPSAIISNASATSASAGHSVVRPK